MYQLDIIVCNFESFLSDRYIHSWNVKYKKKIWLNVDFQFLLNIWNPEGCNSYIDWYKKFFIYIL